MALSCTINCKHVQTLTLGICLVLWTLYKCTGRPPTSVQVGLLRLPTLLILKVLSSWRFYLNLPGFLLIITNLTFGQTFGQNPNYAETETETECSKIGRKRRNRNRNRTFGRFLSPPHVQTPTPLALYTVFEQIFLSLTTMHDGV